MSDLIDRDYILNATLERTDKNTRDPSDVYSEIAYYPDTYFAYEFQIKIARRLGGKVLNAACANDPAQLGDPPVNATNYDIQSFEETTGQDFSKVKNFVNGSILAMPFEDESYDTVILGEFMEHCIVERAEQAILECRRVLKHGGHLAMTFPLDARPREEQEDGVPSPNEYCPGITCHHQTWWTPKMLYDMRRKTKMVEVGRAALFYMLTCPLSGLGLVWRKP